MFSNLFVAFHILPCKLKQIQPLLPFWEVAKRKKYKVKLFYDWEQINECGSAAFFTTPLVNFPSKLISGGSYDLRRKCVTDSLYTLTLQTPLKLICLITPFAILNLQIQKAIQEVENWTSFGALIYSRAHFPFESGVKAFGHCLALSFYRHAQLLRPRDCSKSNTRTRSP